MKSENRKELLTAEEAADYLNVSKATILKWARKGKIERVKISAKIVLFSIEAIDSFLKEKTNRVELATKNHQSALRATNYPQVVRKGGGKKNTGESWRDLRQEVSSWD
ncbi:helix-turn-helix domain-containing protein [Desulfomonile tiedjei]|uniref:DNA-binding protein, excisionase family n=1 Tax=Desulfomonile tiedjei (strain ATCC 49306 / DSM 6799 / DCB-1) TaxID=706587 RepID=I4C942_DESTA|nr:helix-turn-helix domain-containing protein [Desulfomonile tiedjei]AFM26083.1 DNA-binding protein, excisionase family [Desulfomonile tiedjei DSM 6799]